MKLRLALPTFALAAASVAMAAQTTMTGKISDSMCDKDHSMTAEGGKQPDPKECTLACVKAGSKFVFVSGDKIYQISNQDFEDLKTNAGGNVQLTGEVAADGNTIKAEKIEAAK